MPKLDRIINIYNKGSKWLILDSDDITPLYNIEWRTHTLPHMVVRRPDSDSKRPVGTASFWPRKKMGFFAVAADIELELGPRRTTMNKSGKFFSTDTRPFDSTNMGTLFWKGGVTATPFLKLVDGQNNILMTYRSQGYNGRMMGRFEIFCNPFDGEMLDEAVVTGIAMISEQSTSMGQTAANLSSAGFS